MPKEPAWRKRFRERFGFTPDQRERERFLRHVAFEGGVYVWRGSDGYDIDGRAYDPRVIGDAMLAADVRVSRERGA